LPSRREVQQRLLPAQAATLQGFDLAGRMYPAKVVGGDYYDYIRLPQANLGLVIADVSGKGVAAALLTASVEMALRMDAPSLSRSDEIVSNLNRLLYEITDAARYVTLFYGKLDVANRCLQYTNAGHLPPILLRASAEEVVLLEKGGPVIGLIPGATFESEGFDWSLATCLSCTRTGSLRRRIVLESSIRENAWCPWCGGRPTCLPDILWRKIYASVVEFTGTDVFSRRFDSQCSEGPGRWWKDGAFRKLNASPYRQP